MKDREHRIWFIFIILLIVVHIVIIAIGKIQIVNFQIDFTNAKISISDILNFLLTVITAVTAIIAAVATNKANQISFLFSFDTEVNNPAVIEFFQRLANYEKITIQKTSLRYWMKINGESQSSEILPIENLTRYFEENSFVVFNLMSAFSFAISLIKKKKLKKYFFCLKYKYHLDAIKFALEHLDILKSEKEKYKELLNFMN